MPKHQGLFNNLMRCDREVANSGFADIIYNPFFFIASPEVRG